MSRVRCPVYGGGALVRVYTGRALHVRSYGSLAEISGVGQKYEFSTHSHSPIYPKKSSKLINLYAIRKESTSVNIRIYRSLYVVYYKNIKYLKKRVFLKDKIYKISSIGQLLLIFDGHIKVLIVQQYHTCEM